MNKKMSVKDFVNKYNDLPVLEREAFVKTIIVDEYVPFEKKVHYCNKVIESSSYKKEIVDCKEKKRLHVDSTGKYMLYSLTLIKLYTILEIDYKDSLNIFNLLNGNNSIDTIVKCMPERELREMKMILDMVSDDLIKNEYEINSFVDKQINKVSLLVENFITPMLNNYIQNIDKDKIIEILSTK